MVSANQVNYPALQFGLTTVVFLFLLINYNRKLDINSLPAINVASLPSVAISSMPDLTVTIPTVSVAFTVASVAIISMPSVAISSMPSVGITNTPSVVIASMPSVAISSMPSVGITNTPSVGIATFPEMFQDAFGRARVSEPYTLGDYKNIYGSDPGLLEYTANGGLITYAANEACATLTVGPSANSRAIHQSRMYHHYMPGKSQMMLTTFVFGAGQLNITKRTGYFDDYNGIYLEQATDGTGATTVSWNIRSYVGGSLSYETATQSNWNINTLLSGSVILDLTKTQIAFIDFEWLGVGTVRVGFIVDGKFYVVHKFHHSNIATSVYMSNPNLPSRCEVLNTSTTIGSMKQICSTVMSEGGYVEAGMDWAATTGNTADTLDVGGTNYPILAIRLKNSFKGYPNRMVVRPENFSFFALTNGIMWSIYKLNSVASLGGTPTWNTVSADSGVEYCIDATSFTPGDLLESGFIAAGSANTGNNAINLGHSTVSKRNYIVQNFDSSSSEIYLLAAMPIGTGNNLGAKCHASLQWREIY